MSMFDWGRDPKVIEKHINKHILNSDNDKSLEHEPLKWKNRIKYKFDEMVEEYKIANSKERTVLFDKYYNISRDLISNYNDDEGIKLYIYKSKGDYSCNFSDKDNLTTCTKLFFSSNGRYYGNIVSCFFRETFSFDSAIFGILRNVYQNGISIGEDKARVRGVLLNDELVSRVWHSSINLLKCKGYRLDDKKHFLLIFLYKYLIWQYKHYENCSINKGGYEYYYYLLKKIAEILNNSKYKKEVDSLNKYDVLKIKLLLEDKIRDLKNILDIFKDIDNYEDEMSFLLTCYYCFKGYDENIYDINLNENIKDNMKMVKELLSL